MEKSKILILHDTFLYKGGWERLIFMMWKALKADIASWFFSSGSFDLRKEGFKGKMIPISSEIFAKWFRHIKLKWNFLFSTKFIAQYDTVLFSGDSISAVRNCLKDTKKIYYCHTPPRYIYDLHDLYLWKVKWYLRPIFKLACRIFKFLYERDLKKIDLILTNSENTKARIKKYLWYDSHVLYPPVDVKRFVSLWQKWYFLSFARLADAKRVDKIVEAFTHLPDENLIVIYGKNDPQREKIFKIAKWYANVELITLDDNDLLYDYIGNARATIYIPIDEDFWMSPVESMSAGKPVLWVNDGWLKETIIHEKTGYLINPECHVKDIISAVKYLTLEKSISMQYDCELRAAEFGLDSFEKQLKQYMK
jgi:glycosyltransferase involved in cell wall biosynthesis